MLRIVEQEATMRAAMMQNGRLGSSSRHQACLLPCNGTSGSLGSGVIEPGQLARPVQTAGAAPL